MNTRKSGKPTLVDLFAGVGLFSYAFRTEGLEIRQAVELDRVAASTYEANLGRHVDVGDVRELEPRGTYTVLVAAPLCEGFSTLGS